LPRWKNTEIFQKGSHYNGRPGKYIDVSERVSLEKYDDFSKVVSL
jgi:hypothetical protein